MESVIKRKIINPEMNINPSKPEYNNIINLCSDEGNIFLRHVNKQKKTKEELLDSLAKAKLTNDQEQINHLTDILHRELGIPLQNRETQQYMKSPEKVKRDPNTLKELSDDSTDKANANS